VAQWLDNLTENSLVVAVSLSSQVSNYAGIQLYDASRIQQLVVVIEKREVESACLADVPNVVSTAIGVFLVCRFVCASKS
jgi:hypothetical protein